MTMQAYTGLPDWKSLTAAERLEIMEPHRANGASASEMALLFGNCSRNAVIGQLFRSKRPLLGGDSNRPRTTSGMAAKRGGTGNPGQPKAKAIVSRARVKRRAADAAPVRQAQVPRLGCQPLPPEEGVDVTRLVGLADRRIGHECAWVHGDPLHADAGYCGQPTVRGSEWCEAHHRRVYPGAG